MAAYQSLYRRYRPQRFDEVLGQDHVTKALRNAVREGRVGHAYLFSGPRGTGKTSTARVLAKVLNCAAPVDGEPCGKCDNCVAVAEGRVTDWLLEQDAASKSKVDDMRDLLERVPLGTSGKRKVIILDEVHMLSQGAENALLKTLEEPPEHVVFVLATTDPQKVRPTIRSRTQHFEFRLLAPDLLAAHVRHVIADAGLGIDAEALDRAVDHVLRTGGGSARDTLSALDQVAALGEVVDEAQPIDAVLDALCERDAGRVLLAVADALAAGRDPRTLGEALITALRDAFLATMGAADEHLPPAERERAARVGERLGPSGLTRALEVLGEALVELARKPDPRIVVEVALVRLTQPSTDRTLDAVLDRLDRLETAIGAGRGRAPAPPGGGRGGSGGAPQAEAGGRGAAADARAALSDARGAATNPASGSTQTAAGPGASATNPEPGSTQTAAGPCASATKPAPGPTQTAAGPGASANPASGSTQTAAGRGAEVAPGSTQTAAGRGAETAPVSNPTAQPRSGAHGPAVAVQLAAPDTAASAPAPPDVASASPPSQPEVVAAWGDIVLATLPRSIRSRWRGGRWIAPEGGMSRFAVSNEWHQKACDESRREVEAALGTHFGAPVRVAIVVDGDSSGGPPEAGRLGPSDVQAAGRSGREGVVAADDGELDGVDPSELRDADDVAVTGVDLVVQAFGGGELVEEEP